MHCQQDLLALCCDICDYEPRLAPRPAGFPVLARHPRPASPDDDGTYLDSSCADETSRAKRHALSSVVARNEFEFLLVLELNKG